MLLVSFIKEGEKYLADVYYSLMTISENLLNEAIKDLQQFQMSLVQNVNAYSSNQNTTLDKKQKEKRANLIKHMTALNQFIQAVLKYQKTLNDLTSTNDEQD